MDVALLLFGFVCTDMALDMICKSEAGLSFASSGKTITATSWTSAGAAASGGYFPYDPFTPQEKTASAKSSAKAKPKTAAASLLTTELWLNPSGGFKMKRQHPWPVLDSRRFDLVGYNPFDERHLQAGLAMLVIGGGGPRPSIGRFQHPVPVRWLQPGTQRWHRERSCVLDWYISMTCDGTLGEGWAQVTAADRCWTRPVLLVPVVVARCCSALLTQ